MNDDLFTEPNDEIQNMIDKAVKKAVNECNESSDYSTIINMSSEITDAFKKGGYNRKESVYLTGQLINGFCSFLGGLSL